MVAIPFIAPYLPVESPSFRFSHSYIFKINRLYDILENELNQNKLISGLTGELNIAVTYLLIKEHARVCQFNPLHVLFYQSFRKSKNVQISIFFRFIQLCIISLFTIPMLHLQLHFPFFFLRGIGERPNKRDLWHCIYTMNTNPLLAQYGNVKTDQIHLSETWTKIKGIKRETIFLYKIQRQKEPARLL